MTETCETCRFLKSADEHGNGFCAKLPPTVHVVPIGDAPFADTYWALVTSGDWCGEFQPQGSPVEGIPGISWDWVKYWHAREMALADRALTPTPVAVSEMPVGYQQTEHDPESEARATLLAYNAAHPGAPMTWWPGGDKAPEDWDGGKVLFKTGVIGNVAGRWTATIGYRQKAEAALDDLQHLGQAFDKVAEAPDPAADPVELFKQAIGNQMIKAPHLPWYDFIDAALQAGGLRPVRDLSEEERDILAGQVWATFTYGSGPENTETELARAAIDAVLGPVKGEG